MKRPRKTAIQRRVMGLILLATGQGIFITIKDLHAELLKRTGVSYDALRKTLEVLEEHGMIERCRNGRETEIKPLERGYRWFQPER